MINKLLYDPKLPEVGKALLRRLESKEITMPQFEEECAYWMCTMVQDFKYKPMPEMPYDLRDFYDEQKKDPSYKLSSEFWDKPHIKTYLILSSNHKSENNSNFYWLKWMRRHIAKDDMVNKGRINEVLKTYGKTK